MEVSIIVPMYNAEAWLEPCLESVYDQTFTGTLQLSVYNDCSTDRSVELLESWRARLEGRGIQVVFGGSSEGGPQGVGYAKNRAIEQSNGTFLCFFDADDVMHAERISEQYAMACQHPNALVGCGFHREPEGSTGRYTRWANTLTDEQLLTQPCHRTLHGVHSQTKKVTITLDNTSLIYTSHGPTIIMPTWFCSRATFEASGPWDESGKGTPEDLIFFLRHVEQGGAVLRVAQDLLTYRYHPQSATFSVNEDTIWDLRVQAIEKHVIRKWEQFTIWNAGKQGRKLYRSLCSQSREKVAAFCDVDEKKINKGFYIYEESSEMPRPKVPIVHFTKATAPFIICIKQDLTGGGFEQNLASLHLREGVDYFHFN